MNIVPHNSIAPKKKYPPDVLKASLIFFTDFEMINEQSHWNVVTREDALSAASWGNISPITTQAMGPSPIAIPATNPGHRDFCELQ